MNCSLQKTTATAMPPPEHTDVYGSTNAYLLIRHKLNKLPEHCYNLISSCTQPWDDFDLFIHTSGHNSQVKDRRILFC